MLKPADANQARARSRWAIAGVLLACWVCNACAPSATVEGPYAMTGQVFHVDLPAGWRKGKRDSTFLWITRDGMQEILVSRHALQTPLKHTQRKLTQGMSPDEAAAVILDSLRSDPEKANIDIPENRPIQLAGLPGFKLIYAYRTASGFRYRAANYVLLGNKWVYQIIYAAPERHYFAKDLPAFEKVAASFRIVD
jgi:hypothetical protein